MGIGRRQSTSEDNGMRPTTFGNTLKKNRNTTYVCGFMVAVFLVFTVLAVMGYLGGQQNFEIGGAGDAGNFGGMKLGFAIVAGLGLVGTIGTLFKLHRHHKIIKGSAQYRPSPVRRQSTIVNYDDIHSGSPTPGALKFTDNGSNNNIRRRVLERLLKLTM